MEDLDSTHATSLGEIVNSSDMLKRVDVGSVGPDRRDYWADWESKVDVFPNPFGGPDVIMSGRRYAALVKRCARWDGR